MIAWSVFSVGGVYAWGAVPLMVAAAVLAFLGRSAWKTSPETRTLDSLLVALVIAAAAQLIPLPPVVRSTISPHAAALRSTLFLASAGEAAWQPISVSPPSTVYSLGLVVTGLVVFWTTREACAHGLSLRIVRSVAIIGLFAAISAIAFQSGGNHSLIYGRWRPLDAGARPFGPFVNRNHFATWVLMACPLAAGYVVAATPRRRSLPGMAAKLVALLEWLGTSAAWVAVAGVVMTLGLLVSTSRSGLIAFAVSLAGGAWLASGRLTRGARGLGLIAALTIAVIVAAYVNVQPLISCVQETLMTGVGGRPRIWLETIRVIRDFPLTGTGLGTYQTAMLVYQQSDRSVFINQAHNQYLHFVSEGGALLTIPALVAAVVFVRLVASRLAEDRWSSAWLRIGGAIAVLAVAIQGLWETGLRIPANGVLFGLAAAMASFTPADACRLASPRSERQEAG